MFDSHAAEELMPSTATNKTTKAELLGRAKLAIEAGEKSLHEAAELIGLAQEEHKATQREIAAAVGMSPAWVNRLLKWRRSGYKEYSPFGPTTKAGRVAHAQQRAKASKPRKSTATSKNAGAHPIIALLICTRPGVWGPMPRPRSPHRAS
jgi:hypothetical protein